MRLEERNSLLCLMRGKREIEPGPIKGLTQKGRVATLQKFTPSRRRARGKI